MLRTMKKHFAMQLIMSSASHRNCFAHALKPFSTTTSSGRQIGFRISVTLHFHLSIIMNSIIIFYISSRFKTRHCFGVYRSSQQTYFKWIDTKQKVFRGCIWCSQKGARADFQISLNHIGFQFIKSN